MDSTIIVTPGELYYLGTICQAKYINYAYVAAMQDIQKNYKLYEQEAKASLVSSGILTEDFSGNLELSPDIAKLLKPIFFGEVETALNICSMAEGNTVSTYMFHFYEGNITAVTAQNSKLKISKTDLVAMQTLVESLLAKEYTAEAGQTTAFSQEKVSRVIAVKRTTVGKTAVVKHYVEVDGVMYQENNDRMESVSAKIFAEDVYRIINGG